MIEILPRNLTAKMLSRACNVRLPLTWDDADFAAVGNQDFE